MSVLRCPTQPCSHGPEDPPARRPDDAAIDPPWHSWVDFCREAPADASGKSLREILDEQYLP